MKKWIFILTILAAVPLLVSAIHHQVTPEETPQKDEIIAVPFKAKYHIILVIDGPRYSETFGDSSYRYIPNLGNVLKKQGTLFTNFRNNGPTYTVSGHTAICTGVYQRIPNDGSKLPKNPSIFQYLLKQKQLDKRKAWILSSKGKLEVLGNTSHKKWNNTYMPSTYAGLNGSGIGYPGDKIMWPIFKELLVEHKPTLTLINLLDVDAWAHQERHDRYISSLIQSDQYALELWELIQSDPEMRNQTALYITNDHGRHPDGHKNGYVSHGDGCDGCRHISLLAIGPDFKKNVEVAMEYDQIDLTASIARMLGVDMPTAKGCPIPELVGVPGETIDEK